MLAITQHGGGLLVGLLLLLQALDTQGVWNRVFMLCSDPSAAAAAALLQALDNEGAWSRFVRQGRVQLRCEVLDCE
jgi:hypothetical protein